MISWRKFVAAMIATAAAAVAMTLPAVASAEETVWICKPGQADDLCAGSIAGSTWHDPGPATPLGFTRPENPPVDCFYVYPTVSEQTTPNANLDKDPEVRRVVVQQARMYSRICDVYAPMYRQETDPGIYTEATEVAYQSALGAWRDYLENHNDGRGVILLGHSQGSATLARLIDEEIDPDPAIRKRLVGAILPGANIYVPKGELIGGMYDRIPVCSEPGQYGCLVAYSMFNGAPGDNPPFANLASGYWAYKIDRPDPVANEVVCADPGVLSGDPGKLTPLVNFDYLTTAPDVETAASWRMFPGKMNGACARQDNNHWLNVDLGPTPDAFLTGLISAVASGNNYHVPEVNLAEENLVTIAGLQTDSFLARQKQLADLRTKQKTTKRKLNQAKRKSARLNRKSVRLKKKVRRTAKPAKRRTLKRQLKKTRRQLKSERKRVRNLSGTLTSINTKLKRLDS
ncbi:MAG: DUF3089 domain-containing protein [Actinomycetota bacterium]|nr:DUF3089 domain-containing protein [Actinomycetota bacterium]